VSQSPGSFVDSAAVSQGAAAGANTPMDMPVPGAAPGPVSSAEFWSETLQNRRDTSFSGSQMNLNNSSPPKQQDDSIVMKVLLEPSLSVVKGLCSVIDIQDADELAQAFVRIFECEGNTMALIRGAITREVKATETANLLLRSNSMATKMMTSYSQMIGVPYLRFSTHLSVSPR